MVSGLGGKVHQHPNTVVLSCSDSRVPPEIIFDQALGSLFVIRVAGNILSSETLASTECGVVKLEARLILILGHESCGAIQAALARPSAEGAGSDHLSALIFKVQRNIDASTQSDFESGPVVSAHDEKFRLPAQRNVSAVSADLLIRSSVVQDAVGSGPVKIVQGLYSLETERVEFW